LIESEPSLITVDLGELKSMRRELSDFLRSKTRVSIAAKRNTLLLRSGEEKLSPREVKAYVKRFLHRKGLSETYRVTEEHRVVRIVKRRHGKKQVREKGTPPSSYDTLPYYFPVRP